MKYIVQKWHNNQDGILFCIQRLQEMLFHYSDDIVRAPIHNSQTLLDEYIRVEKDVVNGRVKSYQLDAIMQELKESLLADKILKERYDASTIDDIVKSLDDKKGSMVHYLSGIITKTEYYNACIEYLKKNVMFANHKKEIEFGLRTWIASAVWYGYSPEYIYRYLRNFFDVEVNNPTEKLEKFLNRFDFSKQNYKVYFVFHANAKPYQLLLKERLQIAFEDDGNFANLKKKAESFIGVKEVNALDSYGAVQYSYSALNIFLRFYRAFTNKREDLMSKNALVVNVNSEEDMILPVQPRGYKNIESKPGEDFAEEIDSVVLGCQNKKRETYSQLSKIVDLHNAALKQMDLNDAFVNLWSVLEVASFDSEAGAKIDSVVKSVTPILQSNYYSAVFRNIATDLKNNLSTEKYEKLLSEIDEECDSIKKIACFILLEKYEKLRESMFEDELLFYPNIRNKIYNLYLDKSNKSAFKHNAEKYCRRVKWHIYRLYRVRNAIVHAGETHRRIQVLGEHLHIYADIIIFELMLKLACDEHLNTIEDVLVDTELLIKRKYAFKDTDNIEYEDIELMLERYFIR